MKRGTKIFWGVTLGLLVLGTVLLWQSGWIRPRGASLESVLGDGDDADSLPTVPGAPSAQQQWFVNTLRDATGRDLDIEGDFAAWLLPVPGLVMGQASLSNEQGFGEAPFATIDGLEMRAGSISPFDKEIEVERVALAGLRLHLARDAAGRNNWSDFGDDAGTATVPPAGTAPAPAAAEEDWRVAVARFEIIDAEISLQDAFAGRDWKFSAVEFLASEMRPGEFFPLSLSFSYASGDTAVTIESAARATIAADRWRFEDLSIASSGNGSGWIGLLGDARLSVAGIDSYPVQSRAVYEGIELALNRFDPEDLAAALDGVGISIDPGLLARARSSASILLKGDGTVDQLARTLDLRGSLLLGDGSLVPLTIAGSFDAPRIEVVGSP